MSENQEVMTEEPKKKKWVKNIFNGLFFVLVLGLTIYGVFRGQDLNAVLRELQKCDLMILVVPCILCVLLFILFESIVLKYLFGVLGIKTRLTRCYLYSFIGFFFSCITPGAAGGQPVQLVFMKKDKLPLAQSTLILMLITITYKMVLVLFAVITLIVRPTRIMNALDPVMFWIWLGMFLNVVTIIAMAVIVFWPKIAKWIVDFVINILCKFRFFKKNEEKWRRLGDDLTTKYKDASEFFRTHIKEIIIAFLITVVQRVFLFAITPIVYYSFHLKGFPAIDTLVLQSFISLGADMLPLPGGMGITEYLFAAIFRPVFGDNLVVPALIVSRGFSYYVQLLLSAVMTIIAFIFIFNKKEEGVEK